MSYTPSTPRVSDAEVGFYRGFTFYLKFGTANEAVDIMIADETDLGFKAIINDESGYFFR